jgi:SAM-dependent methyltransferase
VVTNADLLPQGGTVLDVACGQGRHAILFASAGFEVLGVDHDDSKVAALHTAAQRAGIALRTEVLDLEQERVDLGNEAYDVIVVVHYLHRPLFPRILDALRPGGILLYETFTVDQAQRGRPTNPEFLLEHDELPQLVAPLEVLRQRDGDFEDRCVAAVAARKKI